MKKGNPMDYKATLNLPRTEFPMKASLSEREPSFLMEWEQKSIYKRIFEKSKSRSKYILHDGPPYANGHIHIGTALNKILKDFIVKSKFMNGYDSHYVPGWDCHGLPIENEVDKELGQKRESMTTQDVRRRCRAFAERFLEIQREEFKRLGVLGVWENPYLTMSYDYEATIAREFGRFVGKGSVYKGKKPIHWCYHCKTALAEAEVEYEDHLSPSIYVKFPALSDFGETFDFLRGRRVSVVIWTTTPWTLPANLAIAFHHEFDYVAVDVGDEVLILAESLLKGCMQKFGVSTYRVLGRFKGQSVENLKCRHPFIDREVLLVLANYVTLDAGTGCVHTAPGHGKEDYETGLAYGLDIYTPVDDDAKFTDDVEFFAGQFVFDANEAVNEKLRERGVLLSKEEMSHDYPHCWRCKNPIVFRATEQWFISMEKNGLRKKALEAIEKVEWTPVWGKDRIYGMIENRPDWCISRQRAWGVPIIIFYCTSCDYGLADEAVVNRVADIFEKEGADAWFARPVAELLPPGTVCPRCEGKDFRKETDILDVWFDSGVSFAAVCEKRKELKAPPDMYLEGSDQHRGWFHSSLLASVGTRGMAPYREVLTHGFVVDGKGEKMSKSKGNVITPDQVIERYGAEILRLWVAAEDYRDDIKISEEILKRLTEAYRKIRNTCRYILGNLYDFLPSRDAVPYSNLLDLDRWALHRLQKTIIRILKAYNRYEFHVVFHTLNNICSVDLSAFYLDILKDRLYIGQAVSPERRSAQTAMHEILLGLTKLMAPILSFTAEEIWKHLPSDSRREESVHLASFPSVNEGFLDEDLAEKWERVLQVRDQVSKALEEARVAKTIGHPLDAKVEIEAPLEILGLLKPLSGELRRVFIVSQVLLKENAAIRGLAVKVGRADGTKCERCWNYDIHVGKDKSHPSLCGRCIAAVGAD
jgi:isoleucyl-tRNA synthetase